MLPSRRHNSWIQQYLFNILSNLYGHSSDKCEFLQNTIKLTIKTVFKNHLETNSNRNKTKKENASESWTLIYFYLFTYLFSTFVQTTLLFKEKYPEHGPAATSGRRSRKYRRKMILQISWSMPCKAL